jgi:YVTN family beta-propeller protein
MCKGSDAGSGHEEGLMSGSRFRVRPVVAAIATPLVLIGTVGVSASAAPTKAPPKLSAIYLPVGCDGIAVNTKTHLVYTSCGGAGHGSIMVINGTSKTVTHSITSTVMLPGAIAVNPKTDTIYVANSQSKSVSVINGKTNAITHTVKVGRNPDAIAVNPKTNTVYVANNLSNTVSVIKKNKVIHTIKVKHHPDGVAIDPRTNIVFVSFQGVLSSNSYTYHAGMAVISGKKHKVIRLIKPASEAGAVGAAVAVDPTIDRVYLVFNYFYGAILVYNGKTDKLVGENSENTNNPSMIAVNTQKHVMAIGTGGETPGATGLLVYFLNGKNENYINSAGQGGGPTAIAVDPSRNTTYVSSNDLYDSGTSTFGGGVIVLRGT